MNRDRITNWALVVVVSVSAWVAGGAIRSAHAGYSPASTFGSYSYSDPSCATITDPVTVAFTFGNGNYNHPYQHASLADHGNWYNEDGAGQYFYDDFGCSSTDDGAATGSYDRYHMRWETASTVAYGQSYAATPHLEDWNWDFWPFSGHHCVRPGGFTTARSKVSNDFSTSGHAHPVNSNNYWRNVSAILKCDGQYVGSDGYVTYIDLR